MKVYLLCGVPGSGKSWVAHQLKNRVTYIEHDKHNRAEVLSAIKNKIFSNEPLLVDCPFDERSMRQEIEELGVEVEPVVIIETPETVRERYYSRTGHNPAQNVLTRANTIKNKADEWGAFRGTSQQVLNHLQAIVGDS